MDVVKVVVNIASGPVHQARELLTQAQACKAAWNDEMPLQGTMLDEGYSIRSHDCQNIVERYKSFMALLISVLYEACIAHIGSSLGNVLPLQGLRISFQKSPTCAVYRIQRHPKRYLSCLSFIQGREGSPRHR